MNIYFYAPKKLDRRDALSTFHLNPLMLQQERCL